MKKILTLLAILLVFCGVWYFTKFSSVPSITVVAPSGGDVFSAGSTYSIKWKTKNIPNTDKVSVTIRRVPPPPLQTEGQEFDPIVFIGLPNTGVTEWTVSDMYPEGTYVLGLTFYKSIPVTDPITAESKEFKIVKSQVVGGDKDIHGCIGSAGYAWCEARNECERPWEKYCTATTPKTVTFICADSKRIVATFYPGDDKFVDLILSDDRNLSVPRAISASGARYAKADETFVFWNKGDTAFITEGADFQQTYSSCTISKQ